jgi:regulator of replication initiation timing
MLDRDNFQNFEYKIADFSMGKEIKEKLEDLTTNNAQLQEENEHLKDQVQMFNHRM